MPSTSDLCSESTMDSKTVVDVRSGVFAITQEYHEASDLFAKWRVGKSGKRAVGAEECQTLLEEGKSTIEGKFQRCSAQHKARFDRGDSKISKHLTSKHSCLP